MITLIKIIIIRGDEYMSQIVQSVERTLSILEVLSDYKEGLGLTEISERVDLHKSTVYRLLNTLIYKEYVVQNKETNKYLITLKLFELGNKKVEGMDMLSASKQYTKMLMESLNEVVHLVARENNNIVYIDKVEANNTIRMASTIGKRSPMYCTSVGKAMLSLLDEEEVKRVWDNSIIEKRTEKTITDYQQFKKELKLIRERGYAIDDEENEEGVRCVGVAIQDRFGKVVGAVSISGPTIRVTPDKVESIAHEVIKYANKISKEMGFIY